MQNEQTGGFRSSDFFKPLVAPWFCAGAQCSVLFVLLAFCVGARFVLVVDRRYVFFFGSEEPLRSLDSFQW